VGGISVVVGGKNEGDWNGGFGGRGVAKLEEFTRVEGLSEVAVDVVVKVMRQMGVMAM